MVLDQACGTGVVSKSLVNVLNEKQKANLELTCGDFSDSMIDFVRPRVAEFKIKSVEVVKADAADTKLPGEKFTHVLFNFGPMVFKDGQAGLRELHRLLQPGGTLAMSSWKRVGWVDDVRAAFALDPEIPTFPPDEEFRKLLNADNGWDDVEWIRDNITNQGFVDVALREIPQTTAMHSVEEFTQLLGPMVGMLQQRMWTQEQRDKCKDKANEAVISYMTNKYKGGEIMWDWVAIVTKAKKAA